MPMSDSTLENPTLETLAAEVRRLQERVEEIEDLMDLRAAVERNAGKAGTPWEQVKAELDLDEAGLSPFAGGLSRRGNIAIARTEKIRDSWP